MRDTLVARVGYVDMPCPACGHSAVYFSIVRGVPDDQVLLWRCDVVDCDWFCWRPRVTLS